MEKLIKIISSPFNPNMEVFGDIVIKVHVPYSDKDVTVMVNPNIQEYDKNLDKPNVKVRQATVTTSTDETRTVKLDFGDNNIQTFEVSGKKYEIKLMNIGKENMEGQDFPSFEFFVKEISK